MNGKPQAVGPSVGRFFTNSPARVLHHDVHVINWGDRLFYLATRALAICVIVLVVLLALDLFRGAWEAIGQFGLKFLVGTTWDPVARQFGTLPTIIGTLVKASIGLLLAVPISIGSAIFIAFYVPKWLRPMISYPIELLAGIPSIVFGLWGLFVMVPVIRAVQIWLKANFGWFFLFNGPAVYGVGVLAGSVILAIMIIPIITAISRDILLTVPRPQIEGMLALGPISHLAPFERQSRRLRITSEKWTHLNSKLVAGAIFSAKPPSGSHRSAWCCALPSRYFFF